ncbi:RNA-binding protein 44 [Trematomus bernacchii]|uniref:RNA-binding protein 44 n=1 Tax=Trematomus bernacchii TaxID=40690 RepID=UPI00146E5618|nr:RNA-binding protein 44 [Trematomus bernacchii]
MNKQDQCCSFYRSIFELVESHKYLELTDQRLLQWYLRLNCEDRKIIQDGGGLRWFLVRHPALELSLHHVYVKHLEMLPNARDPFHFGNSSSGDGSQQRQHEETLRTEPLLKPQQSYQSAFSKFYSHEATDQRESSRLYEQRPMSSSSTSSFAVCKDPAALANLSLDMDLERSQPWGEPKSQMSRPQGQSAYDTHAEVSPSPSEWPNIEKNTPDYYSVDSIQMDGTEYNDRSAIHSDGQTIPSLVEESSTNEGCFEDQGHIFYSIMENDESILAYETCHDMKAHNNGLHSVDGEALAASSDTWMTAEKHISSTPRVTTCDVMVGTEMPLCTSADTQTTGPETADKHINTEVHMVDLDSIVKAFTKLQEKGKSLACKLRKERQCLQRAELSLLALHYSMCRRHCSTLNDSSAEGGLLAPQPSNPPANIATVLQKLECDYKAMRDQILAGVPLEQQKPLSVDSEKTTTSYIPAQMVGDVLGNVPSGSSQEPQKHDTSPSEDTACPDDQIRSECQQSNNEEKQMNKEKAVPQDRDATHNAHKPEEKQTPAACKDVSTLEAWFDAEEDLQPASAAETEPDPTVITTDQTSESGSKEVESSLLCVSNLPSNASECDVMQWFEKYHASEVSISALKNDLRVAIVMISGAQSAEAAVRELNGSSMHGHALHVEHINRARDETQNQDQDQASGTVRGPESAQTETSKSDSSSADRKLISQPPLSSSLRARRVVCVSPTAKVTMVQENYCTLGGLNTLITELTQLHPGVSRQRFLDALLELKAKHKGVLCGLPLRTIREMTSDLITGPESATQL